ncbi:P-loop containing nucleoside triphosphate hydrolase protein [Phycomyces blakesleeanus]|uniref:RNA helicase n=1 Tax=Phycomyces blakesleeanus TaxID=4837 RepID=A0ABR3B2I0_PHYBL
MSSKKSKAKQTPSVVAAASPAPPPTGASKKTGSSNSKRIVKNGNASSNATPKSEDSPEKKSLFGDWTGKTPVSLLHEHCQKQGWEKAVFEMVKRKQGFIGIVQLSKRNKKTAQMETVSLSPPDPYLPTSIEARHLAATYALHRINSHMPMYRVLPPQYRDYWHTFDQLKTASNQWQYSPDPFTAQPPSSLAKSKTGVDRRLVKEHASAAVPMPNRPQDQQQNSSEEFRSNSTSTNSNNNNNKYQQPKPKEMDEKMRKYWESLPAVHMSAENRTLVENVVKRSNTVYEPLKKPLPENVRQDISHGLVRMGFRKAHVEEALEYCGDMGAALDWLCLHVPEDDLPANFMHANYNPTMTTISHTTQSLGRDWLLKSMTAIGYPAALCEDMMRLTNDDDAKALELLQWRLHHGDEPLPTIDDPDLCDPDDLESLRQEEAMSLEAIYASRYQTKTTAKDGRVYHRIELTVQTGKQRVPLFLDCIVPKDSMYPQSLPIFVIECDALPAYLKLAMIKGLVEEGEKSLGFPLVYMCAEWLSENADRIVSHPPKLREITEQMTGPAKASWNQKNNGTRHNGGGRSRNGGAQRTPNKALSEELKKALEALHQSPEYSVFQKVRSRLPAHDFKAKVVKTVLDNQVTIVSGETGCGKTTQVPQFILDEEIENGRGSVCSILCTQPRKISAIGVAERVASERCEKIGTTVGYAIRGETKVSSKTQLQFCTTGVLLRRLQGDPSLAGISHVMIDEVHERSVDSDFLLIILRQVLKKRKDLKVVLMSATINQKLFSDYFNGAPAIEIPGFTHPVEDLYLENIISMTSFVSKLPMPRQDAKEDRSGEWANWQLALLDEGYDAQTVRTLAKYRNQDKIDYELVANTVRYIVENETIKIDNGAEPAVLIFMPGAMEIKRCVEALQQTLPRSSSSSYEILPLHANLSPQEQTRVFKQVPADVCKIVVATNVAETSITIEGVVYVIDSGRVKETQFDAANNMMHLVETWASRASCKQRRGRAGRTRPGKCFKLFTRDCEDKKMRPQQVPELLRTPLEQLCLQVKSMGENDVRAFLREAIDPPSVAALDSAIKTLRAVDAIDSSDNGDLTALGKHMAMIPADLRISKMLLFGSIFRCLDPVLTLAATMSLKSPFISPGDRREEARQARERFLCAKSDWLTDMRAFDAWQDTIQNKGMREARVFCEENFVSFPTMNEIQNLRRQYADALQDIGFYDRSQKEHYNANAENTNLIKSILFGGLNPNLAKIRLPDTKYDKVLAGAVEREKEAREIKFYTKDDGRVFLHPSSILFSNNNYTASFLTYFSRMTTSKTFIRDGTEIPSFAVLFFGGHVDVDHMGRGLKVGDDGWVKFRAWARIGVLVNQLKRLLNVELDEKIQNPSEDVGSSAVVQAMVALITNDGV